MILPNNEPPRKRDLYGWPLRLIILAGLSLLALLVLFPHLQTGFTTRDDAEIGLLPAQYGGWRGAAWAVSLASGRFSHLLTMPAVFALYRCYLVSPPWFYFLYLGSILLNFVLFYFLLRQLTGSKRAGLFGVVLGLAFLPNNWHHNLLTSYPVVPHLGLSALFCTFLCVLAAPKSRPALFAFLAGIAYLVSLLISEAFVAYLPVILALCVYQALSLPGTWRDRASEVARRMSALVIGLVLYLVGYALFRHLHPSHHDGNRLAPLDLARIWAVIWQYTSSAAPAYFYFFDVPPIGTVDETVASSAVTFSQLFEKFRFEWLAKTVLAVVFAALLLRPNPRLFTARSFAFCLVGGLACLVAPVFLVSLTPQYQDWVVNHRSLAYALPSYAAYFAMTFLLVLFLMAGRQALPPRRVLSIVYVLLASALLSAASLATDLSNYPVTIAQQRSHLKWRTIDQFIRTAEFRTLPEGAVIFAPSLWRGPIASSENHWTEYISQRSGKKVRVLRDAGEFNAVVAPQPAQPGYFLAFSQVPRNFQQFLVFAKLQDNTRVSVDSVYAREFVVFSYGGNGRVTISAECSPQDRLATVQVNGRPADRIEGRVFLADVAQSNAALDFAKLEVRSDVPINLGRFTISVPTFAH